MVLYIIGSTACLNTSTALAAAVFGSASALTANGANDQQAGEYDCQAKGLEDCHEHAFQIRGLDEVVSTAYCSGAVRIRRPC